MHPTHSRAPRYRNLNLLAIVLLLLLLSLAAALPGWRAPIGIGLRLVLAAACLVNGARLVRGAALPGILLLLVGIGLIITALLGYSFNGLPPQ